MKNKYDIYKITSIVLMIDLFVKVLITTKMKLYDKITIIPNFFRLFYVKNTGAAFSMFENNTTILIIVSVIMILIINNLIKKEKSFTRLSIISLGLILGGIFGNLIDRIVYHAVIDYLSFSFGSYDFAIFNIADIGITIGSLLLCFSMIFDKKVSDKNEKKINK